MKAWEEKRAWLFSHVCPICNNPMCINPSLNVAFQHQHPEAYKADVQVMYGDVPLNLLTGPDASIPATGVVATPEDRGFVHEPLANQEDQGFVQEIMGDVA